MNRFNNLMIQTESMLQEISILSENHMFTFFEYLLEQNEA